jgi:trehalose 6-phosphate phosphatase
MLGVDEAIAVLAARPAQTAILVDFDGSLSPIVPHPDDATALPEARDALRALVGRYHRVGIVSGRPVDYLVTHVGIDGVVYVGLYGLETVVAGVRSVDPRVEPYLDGVAAARAEAERRLPDIFGEDKSGVCVTLHWRMHDTLADEVVAVAADLAERYGLDAPQRGRKAVELRPPVPVDKRDGVSSLLPGARVAAFAGDDRGDLPAFQAITDAISDGRLDQGVRIGVLSPEAPPELEGSVDTVVNGPAGLAEFLRRL